MNVKVSLSFGGDDVSSKHSKSTLRNPGVFHITKIHQRIEGILDVIDIRRMSGDSLPTPDSVKLRDISVTSL